jgi:hypothetical protein
MGLFLSMSGVIGAQQDAVEQAMRQYADSTGRILERADLSFGDHDCLVLSQSAGGVTVLYPGSFFRLDEATQSLGGQLGKPVFSFHIHDSDLWMYTLYDEGEVADQFNPIPGYWEEVDEATHAAWSGNAVAVAKRVPGLDPAQIERYFVTWNLGILRSTDRTMAYATDQHCYGDECQLLDFMHKLGLSVPIDDDFNVVPPGVTYRFGTRR